MRVAVLFIFSYHDSIVNEDRWKLPGIGIDLYHAYHFAQKIKADKILVVTDIINDLNVSSIKRTIVKGIVDVNIITLIDKIKKNNHYWYYTYKKELIQKINETISNSIQLFIYYTGHSSNNQLVLPRIEKMFSYVDDPDDDPDADYYDANEFMYNLTQSANSKAQIFCVMDCCQLTGMRLPFILRNKVYYTNISKINSKNDVQNKRFFPTQEIICITSSAIDENVLIANHGSIFSRVLFKYLSNIKSSQSISNFLNVLTKECQKIFDQTSNVYVSYPNLKRIWAWILGIVPKLDIKIDFITKTMQISKF